MKKLKRKGNFICKLHGWWDRLTRQIHVYDDSGGKVVESGFIKSRQSLFTLESGTAIKQAQMQINQSRKEAEEIIAKLLPDDMVLLTSKYVGNGDINKERRRKLVIDFYHRLTDISVDLKTIHVDLYTSLDESKAAFRRQVLTYTVAGIAKKNCTGGCERASDIDYTNTLSYKAYVEEYNRIDALIKGLVDEALNGDKLISEKEENANVIL